MQNMKCGHMYAVISGGQRIYTHLGLYLSIITFFAIPNKAVLILPTLWMLSRPTPGWMLEEPWDPSSGTTSHVSSYLLCAWCAIHLTRFSRRFVFYLHTACNQRRWWRLGNMCTYLIRALSICNEVPPLNKELEQKIVGKQPFFLFTSNRLVCPEYKANS